MTPAEWLIYQNQGATRNQPLSPNLVNALGFLPELGVQVEVFSGGQPGKGTSDARVGSTRHDHGNSADVFFRKDGRRLDWARPEDVPILQDIVRRGKQSGLTGFGAGPGYMQPGSMHVGFGAPGVWGAGGKGANAPEWLREAYYGAGDVANDTMMALGREPMGQTMQVSTKSGPMGLLGAVQPDEPSGLLSLLGQSPKWASKANDIGAVLLALSGSPAAAPLLQKVQDRKRDKQEADRINQTVQWLANNGRPDLAEAVAAGTIGGADAARIVLTPPDPMAGLQMEAARLGIEKSQLELQQMQAGADPNVQSSAALPDQSGVVLTMRDGSVVVKTVGGETLSGQSAIDYVRSSQEKSAELQRGIYGARREGTLGADINLGEEAAAAGSRGAEIGKSQAEAIIGEGASLTKAQEAIDLIEQIKTDPALPSITGMFQGRIPPLTQAGTNLDVKVKQLKGKAFLEAFNSLKGGGAITEAEGRAATEAMARLDRAQDEESYIAALNDLQNILIAGQERAKNKAASAKGAGASARRKFNPETGALE